MFILATEKTNKRNIRLEGRPSWTGCCGLWGWGDARNPPKLGRVGVWMGVGTTGWASFLAWDREVEVGRGLGTAAAVHRERQFAFTL